MSKFIFTFNNVIEGDGGHKLEMDFESDDWIHALDNFVLFLRGAGMNIPNGAIAVDTSEFPILYEDVFYIGEFDSRDSQEKVDSKFPSFT